MMNSRSRTLLGAAVLCALAICAFAAQGASAAGLTAVQCQEVEKGTGKYETNRCTTPKVENGNWVTAVIPKNEKREVESTGTRTKTAEEGGGHGLGSTSNPVAVFHTTFNGIEVTITCGTASSAGGSFENIEESGEMKIKGTGAHSTYTECHASPRTKPTKICTVQGTAPAEPVGTIGTNSLSGISGPEHKATVKPETGSSFTKFNINASGGECFTTAVVGVEVSGEAWGRANTETHSHATFDEASNSGSPLRANGNVASMTVTTTVFTKGNKEAVVGAETF